MQDRDEAEFALVMDKLEAIRLECFGGRDASDRSWSAGRAMAETLGFLGIGDDEQFDIAAAEKKIRDKVEGMGAIVGDLERLKKLNEDGGVYHKVRTIYKKLEGAMHIVQSMVTAREADMKQPSDLPRDDFGNWKFLPPGVDFDKASPNARVKMAALNDLAKHGCRRHRGSVVRRIYAGESRIATCAWGEVISIRDYANKFCGQTLTAEDKQIFMDAHGQSGMAGVEGLITALEGMDSDRAPRLKKDRHVFSFVNGAYLAKDMKFVEYTSDEAMLGSLPTAAKHFELPFNPAWCEEGVEPMRIPTPATEQIFDTQGWSPEVKLWAYVSIGRLIYSIGELGEDWQTVPFMKGLGGTGKSKLLSHVANMYESDDVGILSSNVEPKFGLSQLADAYLIIADDVRRNCKLEQTDFQNAASGNRQSFPVKGKNAIKGVLSPMIWSGNEVPAWDDNGGQIGRRLMTFLFGKMVTRPDGSLQMRLAEEMPAFICKCNIAYRRQLLKVGNLGLWTEGVLPKDFNHNRMELTAANNALEGLLSDQSRILLGDESVYMPYDDLISATKSYAAFMSIQLGPLDKDFMRGPLALHNITVSDRVEELAYPRPGPRTKKAKYVYGCDLVSVISAMIPNGAAAFGNHGQPPAKVARQADPRP